MTVDGYVCKLIVYLTVYISWIIRHNKICLDSLVLFVTEKQEKKSQKNTNNEN